MFASIPDSLCNFIGKRVVLWQVLASINEVFHILKSILSEDTALALVSANNFSKTIKVFR